MRRANAGAVPAAQPHRLGQEGSGALPVLLLLCSLLLMPQYRLRSAQVAHVVTERGIVQALVNQKVRALGRLEGAQQLADLAGMLAEWSLVLQGRSARVCFESQQADIQVLNS